MQKGSGIASDNVTPAAAAVGSDPTVLVVMGVSGVGKTTIATGLAGRLGWDQGEGDAMHPPANVAKMRAGIPLTDDDRWPWLDQVHDWITEHLDSGRNGVITCSALKRSYRSRLRAPGVLFVHLVADPDTIEERLIHRTNHYMPPSLLGSQVAALEPLDSTEPGIVLSVQNRSTDAIVDEIVSRLGTGRT